MRILGIDPGTRVVGYGLIDRRGADFTYVECGVIRLAETDAMPRRLFALAQSLTEIIAEYRPGVVALESAFYGVNASSALKLGQARGAAISAVVLRDLPVSEYAAREVKLAVVGTGGADKAQIQHMVMAMLGLAGRVQADAADALAIALTHAHVRATAQRLGVDARLAWSRK